MRNMSFMLTTQQVIDEQKDVTRRLGWWFLYPGDSVCAVEKGMGLKKGEKIVRLKTIIVVQSSPEPLNTITQEEVVREGFPDKSPEWFIDMFCKSHKKCAPETIINRIEFKYYNSFHS